MPEELTGHGVGDDGALVADDRIGDPGRERVAAHRLEHAAGDEQDVDPRRTGCRDRVAGPRTQHGVLADQRAVEVARERLHVAREVRGQRELRAQDFVVRNATRSASCCGLSVWPKVVGMTFFGNPGGTYDGGGLVIEACVKSTSGWPAFLA